MLNTPPVIVSLLLYAYCTFQIIYKHVLSPNSESGWWWQDGEEQAATLIENDDTEDDNHEGNDDESDIASSGDKKKVLIQVHLQFGVQSMHLLHIHVHVVDTCVLIHYTCSCT